MKRYVLAAALFGATAGGALGAPPTAEQLDQFQRVCLGNGGSTSICSCKTAAAPKLTDSAFMDVVLDSMRGKPLEEKHSSQYMRYIVQSQAACPSY